MEYHLKDLSGNSENEAEGFPRGDDWEKLGGGKMGERVREKEIIRGREGCRRGADGDRAAAVGRREIYK